MRMARAGCNREVFATDASVLLHEPPPGPCAISIASPRQTARKKRKLVERDVVTHLIEADTRERD